MYESYECMKPTEELMMARYKEKYTPYEKAHQEKFKEEHVYHKVSLIQRFICSVKGHRGCTDVDAPTGHCVFDEDGFNHVVQTHPSDNHCYLCGKRLM